MKKRDVLTIIGHYYAFGFNSLVDYLERHFVNIGGGCYSIVYTHRKITYVIKVCPSKHLRVPEEEHPLHKYFVQPIWLNSERTVMIQPKASRSRNGNSRVAPRLKKRLGEKVFNCYDLNDGNVGRYQKRDVIYDF